MNCPNCGTSNIGVVKTMAGGGAITRIRICKDCNVRWPTTETIAGVATYIQSLAATNSRLNVATNSQTLVTTNGHMRPLMATNSQTPADDAKTPIWIAPASDPEKSKRREEKSDETIIAYETKDGGPWSLSQSKLDQLQADYPKVNAKAECNKAAYWLTANPDKLKTARGMPLFLVNWLSKATGDVEKRAAEAPLPRKPSGVFVQPTPAQMTPSPEKLRELAHGQEIQARARAVWDRQREDYRRKCEAEEAAEELAKKAVGE